MKKSYILILSFLVLSLISISCRVSKKIQTKRTDKFIEDLMELDDEVISLNFEYRKPNIRGTLIYKDDLTEDGILELVDEFKKLINIDFMKEISDKYMDEYMPNRFILEIDIEKKGAEHSKYIIYTEYESSQRTPEGIYKIDGYKTWYIQNEDLEGIKLNN